MYNIMRKDKDGHITNLSSTNDLAAARRILTGKSPGGLYLHFQGAALDREKLRYGKQKYRRNLVAA